MKAKLQAKITDVSKGITYGNNGLGADISNMTKLIFQTTKGRVDTNLNNAQLIRLDGDLYLMGVIANQIKIGATLTITISDEEAAEET
jgi:hypothetical protein